jgi:hypothetical protein
LQLHSRGEWERTQERLPCAATPQHVDNTICYLQLGCAAEPQQQQLLMISPCAAKPQQQLSLLFVDASYMQVQFCSPVHRFARNQTDTTFSNTVLDARLSRSNKHSHKHIAVHCQGALLHTTDPKQQSFGSVAAKTSMSHRNDSRARPRHRTLNTPCATIFYKPLTATYDCKVHVTVCLSALSTQTAIPIYLTTITLAQQYENCQSPTNKHEHGTVTIAIQTTSASSTKT